MNKIKRNAQQMKLEVDGQPVRECLHPGTHARTYIGTTHTDGRTSQTHNASGPVYWMSGGIKNYTTVSHEKTKTEKAQQIRKRETTEDEKSKATYMSS